MVRPSTAPIPRVIPVQVQADAAPASRHLLRLARPIVRAPAPNLLGTARAHMTLAPQLLRSALRTTRTLPTAPAPRFTLPYPFRELLVAQVVGGLAWPVWSRACWPLLAAARIPERFARAEGALRRTIAVPRFAFAPTRGNLARAGAFALALAIAVLPLKLMGWRLPTAEVRGRVLGATATAADAFSAGGRALTDASFADAARAFAHARDRLAALPAEAMPGGAVALRIGRYLPTVGVAIARAADARQAGIALADASGSVARGLATLERLDLRDRDARALLDAASASFATARARAADARPNVARALPGILTELDRATATLARAESLLTVLGSLAGIDRPQRLLVAFQNPAELRPTGGFLGAIALVDVRNGRVAALELPGGGTYDLAGASRARVLPPDPLRLLQPTWQIQDANWFPDFPTTARKLEWFYAQSSGPSVDAVIAVNAPVLEALLRTTGPITVDGVAYGASDVLAALTNTVESDAARATGTPKAVLGRLAPALLERLLAVAAPADARATQVALLDALLRALDERDILLALHDDAAQRAVVAAGWSGAILPAPWDALMVVHANIGGGKSDARVRDDVAHEVAILDDGTAIDTVTITRTHAGGDDTRAMTPYDALTRMASQDYVRVYVPRGARLLAAEGFTAPPADAFEPIPSDAIPDRDLLAVERRRSTDPAFGVTVSEEFGRTVFGGWIRTPARAQRTVRLTYELPWRYARTETDPIGRTRAATPHPYSLFVQKQPGSRSTFRSTITLSPAWRATWTTPNLHTAGARAWTVAAILSSDAFSGIMVAPEEAP